MTLLTTRRLTLSLACCLLAACSSSPPLTITVLGTNDVHGQLVANDEGRGGLVGLSGYVNAVRDARQRDDGAVLLIDAGDMWQGTLESNLSEGAETLKIFNALGYTAAAIGNHEFDFGPAGPAATPSTTHPDARGALKARLSEAKFPLLAANLIDESTASLVNWENVQPSILIDVRGIKVGIVGVMTYAALQRTIALNVRGLRVSPLAPAILKQASALRDAGANLVIVTAHAGGNCSEFSDPYDLSSCAEDDEIFQVARDLPQGLVDHIIAGHHHEGVAHVVNGISISSSYASALAFGRTDFYFSPRSGTLLERKIYPPHSVIGGEEYEGTFVTPDAKIAAIAASAVRDAKASQDSELGIRLATPFTRQGNPESSLGNLFTNALLASADVDIALHNIWGGLRADLPAGDLTYSDVFEVSPFDNRVVILELSGQELRQIISEHTVNIAASVSPA